MPDPAVQQHLRRGLRWNGPSFGRTAAYPDGRWTLWKMNADGSRRREISRRPVTALDWQPARSRGHWPGDR